MISLRCRFPCLDPFFVVEDFGIEHILFPSKEFFEIWEEAQTSVHQFWSSPWQPCGWKCCLDEKDFLLRWIWFFFLDLLFQLVSTISGVNCLFQIIYQQMLSAFQKKKKKPVATTFSADRLSLGCPLFWQFYLEPEFKPRPP